MSSQKNPESRLRNINRRGVIKRVAAAASGLILGRSLPAFAQSTPAINNLLLGDTDIPLGNYVTVVPTDPCQAFSYAGATSVLTRPDGNVYQLSDMDIGYFFGDYVASGQFEVGMDGKTLTLLGTPDPGAYGIAWVGNGTYYPDGGIYGLGRLEFVCYYDATYAGSGATESVWFDKEPDIPLGDYKTVIPADSCQNTSYADEIVTLSQLSRRIYEISDMDIGYYFGDYVASGEFRLDEDGTTLVLQGADEDTYGIAWTGTGTFYPGGGVNNKGRLEFLCYYDATYERPNSSESIWFDKV